MTATDLVCWSKLICFRDQPDIAAAATPETFRHKVLHVAPPRAPARPAYLYFHLDEIWKWAPAIVVGFIRLRGCVRVPIITATVSTHDSSGKEH